MRIFLIGFMGCGKSTTGKKLANKLGLPFFDSDKQIEQKTGKSISEIIQEQGEEQFRKLEAGFIQEIILKDNYVLATGGGLPCFGENMELLNNYGISVYLNMPAKALYSRLKNAKKKRPLLQGKKEEDLLAFIEELLSQREVFYKKAKIEVEALSLDTDQLKAMIV